MFKQSPDFLILIGVIIGMVIGFLFLDLNVDFLKTLTYKGNTENRVVFFQMFFKIISTNLMVALLISVVGYYTSGILSFLIVISNCINLAHLLKVLYIIDFPFLIKLKMLFFHGILEVFAFYLFARLGMKGFFELRKMYNNDNTFKLDFSSLKIKEFYKPLVVLVMAAIVETIMIKQL